MSTCPAVGCRLEIPPSLLMCRKHWFQVPKPIQAEVWKGYKSRDPVAHAQACFDAVASVAEQEGKTVPESNFWFMRLEDLKRRAAVRAAEATINATKFGGDREND